MERSLLIGIDGNEANVEKRVGSNQFAYELLNSIYKLGEAKRHNFFIYLKDLPLSDLPKEKSWWKYEVFGPRRFWTRFALPLKLYFGRRLDVFFTPGHYGPGFSKIPTIVAIMDLGYLKFTDQFQVKDLYQLRRWTGYSIKKAKHIIAISQSTKKDIEQIYGVSEEKITVVYPGYNKNIFKYPLAVSKIKKIREKYSLDTEYLLFLGTLKPSKNIEGLIDAFALLLSDFPMLKLVIAGKKGWLFDSIFKKVEELNLLRKVVFTDFVPEDDIAPLIGGALVFVLPSYWEGFGIPLIEAMACGTPVVASNVASIPEVLGESGVLVDPSNPVDISRGIKEAIENRSAMVKKGLLQAQKFDWSKSAMTVLHVLESVGSDLL